MDYTDTLNFLYSSLPMYQHIGKAAYKSDLDTTIKLDNYLGNPHRAFRSIHIAGTNGKGSVSHMLAAILQKEGLKTGLYTSPHFIDFRERIRVNGEKVSKKYVIDFVENNKDIIRDLQPSFFEMTVAMAFHFFKLNDVDIAVIETGMGGRLDSTNIIDPEVSVITNIGFDHTQFLGDTLEKIAGEKAGIIKNKVPVVIGRSEGAVRSVFKDRAGELDSDIFFADDRYSVEKTGEQEEHGRQGFNVYLDGEIFIRNLYTDMLGDYQAYNIITVLQVVEILKEKMSFKDLSLCAGLENVRATTGFMGRWQIIRQSPMVICDSGHNPDGLRHAISQLMKIDRNNLHIILGLVNDKDTGTILSIMPLNARYYFTRASIPRAMDHDRLMHEAGTYSLKGKSFGSVSDAFSSAMKNAQDGDIIYIGGSTFVVADFLKEYYGEK